MPSPSAHPDDHPLPWTYFDVGALSDANERDVLDVLVPEGDARDELGERVALAVNCHERLVEAVKALLPLAETSPAYKRDGFQYAVDAVVSARAILREVEAA